MDTPYHISYKLINLRRHIQKIRNDLTKTNALEQIVILHLQAILRTINLSIEEAIALTARHIRQESRC